jgi:hypothetical protein
MFGGMFVLFTRLRMNIAQIRHVLVVIFFCF